MAAAKSKPMKVKHLSLEKNARIAIFMVLLINLAMWLVAAYYYSTAPSTKLLLLPIIYTAVIAFVLLVLRFRYALLERYPYMLNLPSFVYRLGMDKNTETHGKIINRIFTVWCIVALYLSVIYAGVTYLAFLPNNQSLLAGLLLPFILIMVAILIITIFAIYRSIYRSFAAR